MGKKKAKRHGGERVIYYSDELSDEFSTAVIEPRKIDKGYVYVHSSFWKRLTHLFWYRIVAMPIAYLYTKIKFKHKIETNILRIKYDGFFGWLFGSFKRKLNGLLLFKTLLSIISGPYSFSTPIKAQ